MYCSWEFQGEQADGEVLWGDREGERGRKCTSHNHAHAHTAPTQSIMKLPAVYLGIAAVSRPRYLTFSLASAWHRPPTPTPLVPWVHPS